MVEDIEKLKSEHLKIYKEAVKEIILNNNKALFLDDISSLLEKPPLDSMDCIKSKLLSLAKKYEIVLNIENVEKMLDKFRVSIKSKFPKVEKIREKELLTNINNFLPNKDLDTIKITKKSLNEINKKIKKESKKIIIDQIEMYIIKKSNTVFSKKESINEDIQQKFINDFSKYILKKYPKELLESIELKVLVKDTTLLNGVKEQTERYLFMSNNSRLLK